MHAYLLHPGIETPERVDLEPRRPLYPQLVHHVGTDQLAIVPTSARFGDESPISLAIHSTLDPEAHVNWAAWSLAGQRPVVGLALAFAETPPSCFPAAIPRELEPILQHPLAPEKVRSALKMARERWEGTDEYAYLDGRWD